MPEKAYKLKPGEICEFYWDVLVGKKQLILNLVGDQYKFVNKVDQIFMFGDIGEKVVCFIKDSKGRNISIQAHTYCKEKGSMKLVILKFGVLVTVDENVKDQVLQKINYIKLSNFGVSIIMHTGNLKRMEAAYIYLKNVNLTQLCYKSFNQYTFQIESIKIDNPLKLDYAQPVILYSDFNQPQEKALEINVIQKIESSNIQNVIFKMTDLLIFIERFYCFSM